MSYFYVLFSEKPDRYYYGSSDDVNSRLVKHLENHKGFTGKAKDWKLVYTEEYDTISKAGQRELQVKRKKNPRT